MHKSWSKLYSDIFKISKIKRILKLISGQYSHITRSVKVRRKWYGNNYGGFYICPDLLNKNSIVYSFGIGEDISFDKDIIENYNCQVFGFDPTPKSINWVKQNKSLPLKFSFFEYGIADRSGLLDFYLPINPEYVSGSFVKQDNVDEKQKVVVEMKSLDDIVVSLGNKRIDILKMDIEGAEYNVLDSILESSVKIKQILIEFHERFVNDGKSKTINAIQKLKDHGFEIFGISDTFQEISFINNNII